MKKAKRRFQARGLHASQLEIRTGSSPRMGRSGLYVWEWPVRFVHWILFGSVASLSITGYYMHSPYIVPHGNTAYVMGTMRFVHVLSGFVLLGAFLIRVVWMFIGNRWSRWDQLIPTTKARFKDLIATGSYYGYHGWEPTPHIGHNALAGLLLCRRLWDGRSRNRDGLTLYSMSSAAGCYALRGLDSASARHSVAARNPFPRRCWPLDVLHPSLYMAILVPSRSRTA